jgi:hypothetical protein
MIKKDTNKEIEALAVLFGGGILLLIIADIVIVTAVYLLL